MNILIVNDDSIHAPGIALLAREAMKLGEVTVVAPAQQCSAMSQKISIRGTLAVEPVDFPVAVKAAYKVDGTPADCVKVALKYILKEKPDFVFSGINDGFNVGYDIAYSGTLGAAFEAVMNGIPAAAFSCAMGGTLAAAEHYLADLAREIVASEPVRGEVWNVNFPGCEPAEVQGILRGRTVAALQFYKDSYRVEERGGGCAGLIPQGVPISLADEVPEGSDAEAVLKGCISVGKVKSVVL